MNNILVITLILICTFLIIWSFIKWGQSIAQKRNLKHKELKIFEGIRITSFSYDGEGIRSKISMGIYPIKAQMIFTEDELYFLPKNYSLFLGMTELPRSLHKPSEKCSFKRILPKELMVKFENKDLILRRNIIEISVTSSQSKIDEIENYLMNWLDGNSKTLE